MTHKNVGSSSQLPSRSQGTPIGFRNVRVIVPQALHWRLLTYASQSQMSLPQFVVSWLEKATSLGLKEGPQGPPEPK